MSGKKNRMGGEGPPGVAVVNARVSCSEHGFVVRMALLCIPRLLYCRE